MNKHLFSIALATICMMGCNLADARSFFGIGIKGDGNVTTTERTVAAFDRIDLAGSADVRVHLNAEPRVVITVDNNLLPIVKTEVKNGKLSIGTDKSGSFTKFSVEVYTQTLTGLAVLGSGEIKLDDEVQAASFDVSVSGSGEVKGTVRCTETLDANISGSGEAKLSGACKTLNVKVTGSGEFKGKTFEAKNADVNLTGSGEADVWATENLNVKITGSGEVSYRGNPKLTTNITGSGGVKKED
ncbi:hypothetical protein FACS189452_05170 [Bacteroidia bacterium]|nr:hypothetical protein FACS189452_05170 [Bacteroidia bacterium]